MKCLFTCFFVLLSCITLLAQQVRIHGIILDAQHKTPLAGAFIYSTNAKSSSISNESGKFICTALSDQDTLIISFLGYTEYNKRISAHTDTNIVIFLEPSSVTLEKFVVTQKKETDNIEQTMMGQVMLSSESIKQIPQLMGEPDIIRALSVGSGVSQQEGSQGMQVRGGGQEQNLILYDGATIYNPSHLLGFFSIFNGDIISSAKMYTSGIPAEYGGRLSSVLQIQSLAATPDSIQAQVSLGILSSRAMCNIPINSHSALRVSFRKTYLNLFVLPLVEKNLDTNPELDTKFGFYDATLRYDLKISTKDFFSISTYHGKDVFTMLNYKTNLKNDVQWGNNAVSSIWKHISSQSTVHMLTYAYSNYGFDFNAKQNFYTLDIATGIENNSLHYVVKKKLADNTLTMGINMQFLNFNTSTIKASIQNEELQTLPALHSNTVEAALFAEHTVSITNVWNIQYGLRLTPFAHLGPYTNITYNQTTQSHDTTYFKKGQILYKNLAFEPRLYSKFSLSSRSAIKGAIARNVQQLHMISMLSAALPADIWMPASSMTPAVYGMHYSVGYFQNIANNTYECSMSMYYKTMHNIIEFKDGFFTIYQSSFNEKLDIGKGFAAGTELLIRKTKGDFQGSVSYIFSRTLRKFPNINQHIIYPASYDKPHDISILLQYAITKKLNIAALWIYTSGKVYSEPISKYFIQKNLINEYNAINSKRMPAYHRLDLSVNYNWFSLKHIEGSVQFSLYNAYNRTNPYYIYYETIADLDRFKIQMIKNQVGLFPILPSISIQCNIH